MFTGIVQHLGKIVAFDRNAFGAKVSVDAHNWPHRPVHGDSIALDGCCLTVANRPEEDGAVLRFDVVQQTLATTTLGHWRPDQKVNLEHAVTPATLLGGHIMQGHVDGVGIVKGVDSTASEHRLRISPVDRSAMQYAVEKGSIAVNGVSLTVATVGDNWFEVALIPTTLALTNLGTLGEGHGVNLEFDYIAKIVISHLRRSQQK